MPFRYPCPLCSAAPFLECSGVWPERNVLVVEGREGMAKWSESSFLLLGLSSRAIAGHGFEHQTSPSPSGCMLFKGPKGKVWEIFKVTA